MLGGKLNVKSEVGHGSVFTITLNMELLTSEQKMIQPGDFLNLINIENMMC